MNSQTNIRSINDIQKMEKKPAISIAMCTYNGAKYLEEQLQSILSQTLKPQEMVIIDDASQDETIQILTAFKTKAPFEVTIVLNETNQGLNENPWNNFFRATALCRNELISFCDQDDVWYPLKLEILAELLIKNEDVMMSFCNATVTDENLQTVGLLYGSQPSKIFSIYDFNLPHFLPLGFTQLFRKSLIPSFWQIRPRGIYFDRPMAHDEFIALLAICNGKIAYCSEVLALYRRHSKAHSISSSTNNITSIISDKLKDKVERYYKMCRSGYITKSDIYLNWSQYFKANYVSCNYQEAADFFDKIHYCYALRASLYTENNRNILTKLKYFKYLVASDRYYLFRKKSMRFTSPVKDVLFILLSFSLSLDVIN